MAIHSSTLAWKIPWMEEPDRLQSMWSQRVGHDWATSLHFIYLRVSDNLWSKLLPVSKPNSYSLFLHLHISQSPSLCFKTVIVLLIYFFWLHWVFIALRGLSLVASRAILHCGGRLLIKVASLVAEQALGTWSSVVAARGLRSCGSQALGLGLNSGGIQASLLWGVWNLPRPEIKLVPPALACGFWSTVLSEKSQSLTLSQRFSSKHKDTVSLPQSTVLSLFHMVLCSAYKSAVNIIHSHPFLLWTMILCLLELWYHSTNLSYTLCSGKTGLWNTGT